MQVGYTHANWYYTDEITKNIDSYDEASAYPYVLTCFRFPMRKFERCYIKKYEDMLPKFAYLIRIRMINVKSKYYNNFISKSRCEEIQGCMADNGRVISCNYLIMTITDVDFRLFKLTYDFDYEILESYYSVYNYLPKQLIEFILEKYEKKTALKNVEGYELEYNLNKANFNSIYGMCVTNTIRDEVIYDNIDGWSEIPLTNEDIEKKLISEEKQAFLSFSWGCWCTSISRFNLITNIIKQDFYCAYADTDSMKLAEGYNKDAILEYNEKVLNRIKHVSKVLDIPLSKFMPKDIKGREHPLGVFEMEYTSDTNKDHTYSEFITQGAKKYAYKTMDNDIKITVAGVPKDGAKGLKSLNDFRDDFIFKFEDTNKLMLAYTENQEPMFITDYRGTECYVQDKSGCCLIPTTYTLGKALDYLELIEEKSSNRAMYMEDIND